MNISAKDEEVMLMVKKKKLEFLENFLMGKVATLYFNYKREKKQHLEELQFKECIFLFERHIQ